jgi:hypothetical protein
VPSGDLTRTGRIVLSMTKRTTILSAALLAVSSVAGAETLTPNSQQYANSRPDTVGQSGTSTLTTRALLGKSGDTDIYAITGRIDGAPGGNLLRVLLQAYDGDERIAWSQTFANLSTPTFETRIAGMTRGQPVQVRGTIRSADNQRSDVVVTSTSVRLRPDLAVDGVEAPSRSPVGSTVSIVSIVREANGDMGAHANCRLRVNGAEVDRAEGIYVDAGSAVACQFRHAFDVVGTYGLEVDVDGVEPGDWDLSNNRGTASITIENAGTPFSWIGQAQDVTGESSYADRGCYVTVDGVCPRNDFEVYQHQTLRWQFAHISGWSSTPLEYPVTLSFSGTSDGAPFADERWDIPAPNYTYDDGWLREVRYQYFDYTTGLNFYVENYTFGDTPTTSKFTAQRYASDIIYFSSSTARDMYQYDGPTYYYASLTRDVIGQFWPMTGTVAMSLAASDAAAHNWTATSSLAMAPMRQEWNQTACDPLSGPWGTGSHCQTWQGFYEGVSAHQWGSN